LLRNINIFFVLATAIERESGECPTCHEPVPAESTMNLSVGNFDLRMPSANGDRQMFPKQTIKILTFIKNKVSFFYEYRLNFFELFSGNKIINCFTSM
jgi:hypothetical protein